MSEQHPVETVEMSDKPTCACLDCETTVDEDDGYTLALGADIEGMLASYGTAVFCSLEHVRAFHNRSEALWTDDGRTHVFVHDGESYIGHIEVNGIALEHAIGVTLETVQDKLSEALTELATHHEMAAITVTYEQLQR